MRFTIRTEVATFAPKLLCMRAFLLTILTLFFLLPCGLLRAEGGTFFVVNGQSCTHGVCAVDMARFGMGGPLRLSLAGDLPTVRAVDFAITYSPGDRKLARGVILEFNGHSVNPGQGVIRVADGLLHSLWGGGGALFLHTGELNATSAGTIKVKAFAPGAAEPFAQVHIVLEGLKTPGELPPWDGLGQFSEWRPVVVPIYPNPVRSGSVHIDLQGVSSGRRGQVAIVDLLGGTVLSMPFAGGGILECPTDGLSKGIYFVRVEVEGATLHTGRLVIDR